MKTLILICLLLMSSYPTLAQDKAPDQIITFNSQAYGMRLSPDGKTIAIFENSTIHNDEIVSDLLPVRLIDLATGEERAQLTGAADYATVVAFSPDSTLLASYHPTGFLYLWDVTSGDMIKEILTFPGGSYIQFLPDNHTLVMSVAGPPNPALLFIDTETSSITQVLMQRFPTLLALRESLSSPANTSGNAIVTFEIMPNRGSIVLANAFGDLQTWDIESGTPTVLHESEEEIPTFSIRNMRLSSDAAQIYYSDLHDGTLSSIEIETGTETIIAEDEITLFALADDDDTVAWLADKDETTELVIASLSDPEQTTRWVLDFPSSLRMLPPFISLDFTPDGQQIVLGGFFTRDEEAENQIMVFDVP